MSTTADSTSVLERLRDRERAVTGEQYHEEILEDHRIGDKLMTSTARDTSPSDDDTKTIAGPDAREIVETHAISADEPLNLGYAVQNQEVKDVAIKISHACRHTWAPGTSGAGKSNWFEWLQLQLANQGHGFVAFDPKGQDSRQILTKLPEHRLDDVVFIDPANPDHEKTVALNILEIPDYILEQGETAVEREISSRKKILKAFFEGDQFWGGTMEFITEVLGDGFLRANVAMEDSSNQYTIIDFFTHVFAAATRENFAAEIDDPFLAAAVQRVSDMDDSETLPTLKRVVPWILNRITRKIISHRESSIDFREIIEEDKIVIVRTAIENVDIKQMLTLGVMRMTWSAVQRRASMMDGEPKPYFVFCDEFDDIVSDQLDMDRMLTKARAMNLGVFIAHQHPSQIERDYEKVLDAIENNCNTIGAFRVLKHSDAATVMSRFGEDYDANDLLESNDYEIWTQITYDNKTSPALKLNTAAPYPKLRPVEVVDDIIEARLEETGVDPLTTQDILQSTPYPHPYGVLGATMNGDVQTAESAKQYQAEAVNREIVRAIFDEAIHRGVTTGAEQEPPENPEWWIDVDTELYDRADRYVYGGIDTEESLSTLIDDLAGSDLRTRQNGGRQVTVTDAGRASLFEQGDTQTTGRGDHSDLGEDSIIALTRLGLEAEVAEQTGGRDVDGVVRIRECREVGVPDGVSLGALGRVERQRYEQMAEEHPRLTWLTDGADCTVEFESSTAGRKSIINWVKAFNAGEVCLFTAREADASKVWNAISEPTALKSVDEHPDGRVLHYYNHTRKIRIGGERLVIEDAETAKWSYDERDEQYVLSDGSGSVRARFDTHHEIYSNRSKYDGVESDYADAEFGNHGPHLAVNMPILPERAFNIDSFEELDHERDTRILVIPENVAEDDRPIGDIISVYRDGLGEPVPWASVGDGGDESTDEAGDGGDDNDGDGDDGNDFSSLFVGDRRDGGGGELGE